MSAVQFPHIGERLRARRLGAGLSTEAVAQAAGISRALLYRYEAGDVVKLEVLERLARLYDTSTGTLLGLGNEYITHGMLFFERVQRLEESALQMTTVFGPQAYVLSSAEYDSALAERLGDDRDGQTALQPLEVQRLMQLLTRRKAAFERLRPGFINIIPVSDIEHYLRHGLGGHAHQSEADRLKKRQAARREMERLAAMIASPRMGLQIALTSQPLPTSGFQLVQSAGRQVVVTSPFRIVEPTNLHYGVAMVSEDEQSLRLHQTLANRLWETGLRGAAAGAELARLLRENPA
ncbi:helix-turn-helix domain-containing protein [Xylophilus rhododendri]|uniref:Helix-turn-helix domain-containing protein n=1 Tax=Xylophilus rhododendri TaxID=2697032 RepID=A0A857J456_9BURK|nr:helix-turn-helix transcriptional regulator [Xylophilus rhododendri]QHI97831.1 helix-turn-helix domain-containing protein [Xylophilus rhododendri]